jgi:oxygen-independent coproporphyrinogen-3 oxidase
MIEAIVSELKSRAHEISHPLKTIYFGGGTPSVLNKAELLLLMQTISEQFETSTLAEVTLEANPEDINPEQLANWLETGINRLSIGVQSYKAKDLQWMNRAHHVDDSLNAVLLAKQAGFQNLSVDLMYGLPQLTDDEWELHVHKTMDLGVQHISSYCLTVEKNTALHSWVRNGKINVAPEEKQAEQFKRMVALFSAGGFEHYEISNFALPGYRALHNSNYWKGSSYLGVGPSAHSYDGRRRRWNIANNAVYMKMEKDAWFETEILTPKDRWNELILVGLRTAEGIDLVHLFSIDSPDLDFEPSVKKFEKAGWITRENTTLKLTAEGKLRADYISSELFKT